MKFVLSEHFCQDTSGSIYEYTPPTNFSYVDPQGIPKETTHEKFTNAFILEWASVSTLPFGIDDPAEKPNKGSDLSDIVVD